MTLGETTWLALMTHCHHNIPSLRIINGVKEMCGFRITFNLSYTSDNDSDTCSEASCSEGISESTILVSLVCKRLLDARVLTCRG